MSLPQMPGVDMTPLDALHRDLSTDATSRAWTLRDLSGNSWFGPQRAGPGPDVSGLGLGAPGRSRSEAPELGLLSPSQSWALPDPGRDPLSAVREEPVLRVEVCNILWHGVVPHSGSSAFRGEARCEVGDVHTKLTPHSLVGRVFLNNGLAVIRRPLCSRIGWVQSAGPPARAWGILRE